MRCHNCPKASCSVEFDGVFQCNRRHVCISEDITRRAKYDTLDLSIGDTVFIEGKPYEIDIVKDRWMIVHDVHGYLVCDLNDCIYGESSVPITEATVSECLKGLLLGHNSISLTNWSFLDME